MNFSEFSSLLHKQIVRTKYGQGHFVHDLFAAMQSNFFAYTSSKNYDYEKKLYNGNRLLNEEMKASIPDPFPLQEVAEFLSTLIDAPKLESLKESLGFSKSIEIDKQILFQALARQYQFIFESQDNDVACIVVDEYERLQNSEEGAKLTKYRSLYAGDDAVNYTSVKSIQVEVYENFTIEFEIMNSGKVPWRERKLVFDRKLTSCPRPVNGYAIPLPKVVEPKKSFKIKVDMNARGSEGSFSSHFVMQDAEGNDCFPNRHIFDVRVNVTFTLQRETEAIE